MLKSTGLILSIDCVQDNGGLYDGEEELCAHNCCSAEDCCFGCAQCALVAFVVCEFSKICADDCAKADADDGSEKGYGGKKEAADDCAANESEKCVFACFCALVDGVGDNPFQKFAGKGNACKECEDGRADCPVPRDEVVESCADEDCPRSGKAECGQDEPDDGKGGKDDECEEFRHKGRYGAAPILMERDTFLSRAAFSGSMRTANPALSERVFRTFTHVYDSHRMTLDGTVNKTGMLLLLVMLVGGFAWQLFLVFPEIAAVGVFGGAILGFIVALVTVFKQEYSMYLAPLYAVLEGWVLGTISAVFEAVYSGIVLQAVLITVGVLFGLLFAYKSRWVEATENFRLGVFAATLGILFVYLISLVASFFGVAVPLIHESGTVGILFSVFVVVVASLNLVLDFDFIEAGVKHGAPKYMEWYAAFGLLVTLVWLYLEVLRLLTKVRSRN